MAVATGKAKVLGPFPLKSLEGGEVYLRKMKWGESLTKEEAVARVAMDAQPKDGQDRRVNFDYAVRAARLFDFNTCVVKHNLTDEAAKPLDLTDPRVFDDLDSDVGQEIADLIDAVNDGIDLAPFLGKSSQSSSQDGKVPATS